MPFPQPEPELLSTADRVLFWALVTLPLIGIDLWIAR